MHKQLAAFENIVGKEKIARKEQFLLLNQKIVENCIPISKGESNTVVSAYTLYRHLQQYCSHPSICQYF